MFLTLHSTAPLNLFFFCVFHTEEAKQRKNTKLGTMLKELPSLSTILSAYASISAMAMLIRTILNEMLPERMTNYIFSMIYDFTSAYFSSDFTFIIENRWHAGDNQLFRAAEIYLPTIIGPSSDSLLVGFDESSDPTTPPKRSIPVDCRIKDDFDGMRLEWTLSSIEPKKYYVPTKRFFSLTLMIKNVLCGSRPLSSTRQHLRPWQWSPSLRNS